MNDIDRAHEHHTDPEPGFTEADARRMRGLFAARDDRDARREPGLTEAKGEELDALVSRWQRAHLAASRAGAPPAWPPPETDPEPEPIRPGRYRRTKDVAAQGPMFPTAYDVEVAAVVAHRSSDEPYVLFWWGQDIHALPVSFFRERYERLPDAPAAQEPA